MAQPDIPPHTMYLSEDEIRWALSIKGAAAAEEDLQLLTDYEYAHHALVSKDFVEEAIDHIRGLQYFREEYNINDTVEEGIDVFRQFLDKHPGMCLSVDYDPYFGHFVVVYDYAKRKPENIDLPEDWRIHLGGFYYMAQSVTSDLHAIREGVVHICECDGMGFPQINRNHHQRGWEHFWMHYPLLHKEISWLRTNLAANLLVSFLKPFMSDNMRSKFQLGCSFHGYDGRIDAIFKQPTEEIAVDNMIQRVRQFLKMRFHFQNTFKLPDLPPDSDSDDDSSNDDNQRMEPIDVDDGARVEFPEDVEGMALDA